MKKFILFVLIILMVSGSALTVHAAEEPITSVRDFNTLDGDAKYINKSENYYLDLMELSILDTDLKLINNMVNGIFGFEKWLVHITCNAFYFVTTLDFGEILATPIDTVQGSMKTYLFDPLFTLMFTISGIWIAVMLAKRNMQEIMNQTVKVLLIVVFASVLTTKSAWIVGEIDKVTNAASNSIMSAMSLTPGGSANYGATTAGTLWVDLIHTPWKSLEFGTSNIEDEETEIENLLNAPPNSTARDTIVKRLVGDGDEPAVFGKGMPLWRLPLVIAHLLPLTATCILYLLIALLQLSFRLMTIFLMFVGLLVLVLSLVPFLGGTNLLKTWAGKIAEMQIMILSLSFLLGFMTLINSILVMILGSHGWLLSHFVRIGIDIAIFVFRGKIFGFFATVQKGVRQTIHRPRFSEYQMQAALEGTGNVFSSAQNFDRSFTAGVHTSLANIKAQAELAGGGAGTGNIGGGFEPNLKVNDAINPEMYYEYKPSGDQQPVLQQPDNSVNRPLLVPPSAQAGTVYGQSNSPTALPAMRDVANLPLEARPVLTAGFSGQVIAASELPKMKPDPEDSRRPELEAPSIPAAQVEKEERVRVSELVKSDDSTKNAKMHDERPVLSADPPVAQKSEDQKSTPVPLDTASHPHVSTEMPPKPTLTLNSDADDVEDVKPARERPTLVAGVGDAEATQEDLKMTTDSGVAGADGLKSAQVRPTLTTDDVATGTDNVRSTQERPTLTTDGVTTGTDNVKSTQERPTPTTDNPAVGGGNMKPTQEQPNLTIEAIGGDKIEVSSGASEHARPTMTNPEFSGTDTTAVSSASASSTTPKPSNSAKQEAIPNPTTNTTHDFKEQIGPSGAAVSANLELGEETPRETVKTKRNTRQRPTLEKPQAQAPASKIKDTINEQLNGKSQSEISPTTLMKTEKEK